MQTTETNQQKHERGRIVFTEVLVRGHEVFSVTIHRNTGREPAEHENRKSKLNRRIRDWVSGQASLAAPLPPQCVLKPLTYSASEADVAMEWGFCTSYSDYVNNALAF